ncbi:MAG TPA: glycosyltransferase family 39 protein, partial [Pyrinomonadaceae bacterium]|nr:glycosyltransferase family 39 protein [Pyrinomonadaceae bacterium]
SALAVCLAVILLAPGAGAPAVLLCAVLAVGAGAIIRRVGGSERTFLVQLFVGALLVRVLIGTLIFAFELQNFFGGDALTYDQLGYATWRIWLGEMRYKEVLSTSFDTFWGMPYYVASIYTLVGHNLLAVQFVNALLGAATAPAVYMCARHIFSNQQVARLTGLLVGFFPSLVLWSAQGLKDGPIVFLLALAMLATLRLGERLSLKYFVVLLAALAGLLGLRFYIFYMMIIAIGGAFIIGMQRLTAQGLFRQVGLLVGIGLALTYWGVLRTARAQYEDYGSLESVQRSRSDLSGGGAQSAFGKDVDVSTAGGALSAIPLGLVYLLFAPFPWQLANLRQSITLPEMLVWWSLFPLLVLGLWFTLKYRLRQALPILLFTTMLTLAYSVFQGNVGTAYRQRAQIVIFYFMFVAVGYVLLKERREERQARQLSARQAAQATALAQRRYARWRQDKEKELEKLADDLQKSLGF